MRQWLRSCQIMLTLLVCLFASTTVAASAKDVVKNAVDQMIAELKKEPGRIKTDRQYLHGLVERILVPHADFREMSKKVLANAWPSATERQKTQFTHEFKQLVIRTYSEAFKDYTDERVEIIDQRRSRSNQNLVEIRSLIKQNNGPDIPVNYRLKNTSGQWLVYDMKVEGVSLVGNFRAQFKSKLRASGLDALILDIKQRNDKAGM